jgi:hypothetical protein
MGDATAHLVDIGRVQRGFHLHRLGKQAARGMAMNDVAGVVFRALRQDGGVADKPDFVVHLLPCPMVMPPVR